MCTNNINLYTDKLQICFDNVHKLDNTKLFTSKVNPVRTTDTHNFHILSSNSNNSDS